MKQAKTEEEKSSYERLEEKVRDTVFNVLYVLLKEEDHSQMDLTLENTAEMIQIYSFTFS